MNSVNDAPYSNWTQNNRSSDQTVLGIVITVLAVFLICCCLIACLCLGFAFIGSTMTNTPGAYNYPTQAFSDFGTFTPTPRMVRPTATPNLSSPVNPAPPEATSTPQVAVQTAYAPSDTLRIFENTLVSISDPIDLAQRLEGKQNLPVSLTSPPIQYSVNARQTFWVTDSDTNENFQVQATLRYVTDHVYFWVEDAVPYEQKELKALAETFEDKIYPTNRAFFGSEWIPGVDNDPHLYILYAKELGGSVAGYFSSADEYLPLVREYSNSHEMFLFSAAHAELEEEFTYSILAHEFQHMIHWYRDRNEETWLNEGFSNLAALLNNYTIGGSDYAYAMDPDMQLNTWPDDSSSRTEHYGASFLFVAYFLDRFGEEATKAVVAHPADGMPSIDQVLAETGVVDSTIGKPISADDVFADWVIATYLQDPDVADGRFTYHNYNAPSLSATESISNCPQEMNLRDVSQYGADYIQITCQGNYTLHFEGSIQVGVLPVDPHSGSFAYYSNRGDESDMSLTRSFDFTEISGPLTLSYWTWYDLEKDYDYVHVVASTDGKNWQILTTPSGTADDPSGNSYGWGYNGLSGDGPQWIQERVDISQFAGKKVQLRFEYITDAAVNGEGFLLDDIAIPEIEYFTDFENDEGGWQADGFVRIQNVLPQTFRLTLISIGDKTTVQAITLSADNAADIPLHIGDDVQEVVLVVSGVTRFTLQKAAYQFSISSE